MCTCLRDLFGSCALSAEEECKLMEQQQLHGLNSTPYSLTPFSDFHHLRCVIILFEAIPESRHRRDARRGRCLLATTPPVSGRLLIKVKALNPLSNIFSTISVEGGGENVTPYSKEQTRGHSLSSCTRYTTDEPRPFYTYIRRCNSHVTHSNLISSNT